MIQFAALVALAVVLAIGKQHRIPALIAGAAVVVLMGGPSEFVQAALAAVPGV
ncbi:hypothetical protein [Streptomyces sp. NBC_01092]|uniref:hypothetical protein n=1 Tax=Streptomyces sp. NBC_01092 TaxID=2903748 RepID=UPI0038682909|nr:hypothetical protein OG254_38075 [Streptomyces sp. NBC_01092]